MNTRRARLMLGRPTLCHPAACHVDVDVIKDTLTPHPPGTELPLDDLFHDGVDGSYTMCL